MQNLTRAALAVGTISSVLLLIGAVRLLRDPRTRTKAYLMICAAAVILMNVMIWTV